MSNARAAQHPLNRLQQPVRPRRGTTVARLTLRALALAHCCLRTLAIGTAHYHGGGDTPRWATPRPTPVASPASTAESERYGMEETGKAAPPQVPEPPPGLTGQNPAAVSCAAPTVYRPANFATDVSGGHPIRQVSSSTFPQVRQRKFRSAKFAARMNSPSSQRVSTAVPLGLCSATILKSRRFDDDSSEAKPIRRLGGCAASR
jgi:hypothetical protein